MKTSTVIYSFFDKNNKEVCIYLAPNRKHDFMHKYFLMRLNLIRNFIITNQNENMIYDKNMKFDDIPNIVKAIYFLNILAIDRPYDELGNLNEYHDKTLVGKDNVEKINKYFNIHLNSILFNTNIQMMADPHFNYKQIYNECLCFDKKSIDYAKEYISFYESSDLPKDNFIHIKFNLDNYDIDISSLFHISKINSRPYCYTHPDDVFNSSEIIQIVLYYKYPMILNLVDDEVFDHLDYFTSFGEYDYKYWNMLIPVQEENRIVSKILPVFLKDLDYEKRNLRLY